MELLTVSGGTANVGAGHPVSLSKEQIADRAHLLEKDREPHGDRFIVKGTVPLAFKSGEVIGLGDVPRNLTHLVLTPAQLKEKQAADAKAAESAAAVPAPAKKPRKPKKSRPAVEQ